jgi:phospholipase C
MRASLDRLTVAWRHSASSPAAPRDHLGRPGLRRWNTSSSSTRRIRSFDNLYGLFPGANGIANATPSQFTQVDRDGKVLATLPPVWNGKGPTGLSH